MYSGSQVQLLEDGGPFRRNREGGGTGIASGLGELMSSKHLQRVRYGLEPGEKRNSGELKVINNAVKRG